MSDTTTEDYPFYPTLPEGGAEEAQKFLDSFKEQMKIICDGILSDVYCDVAVHIETDSWTNYRNKLMAGFQDYGNRMVGGEHDFKKIRAAIFKDFREDIIKDLNQDHLEKIKELEESIKWLQNARR